VPLQLQDAQGEERHDPGPQQQQEAKGSDPEPGHFLREQLGQERRDRKQPDRGVEPSGRLLPLGLLGDPTQPSGEHDGTHAGTEAQHTAPHGQLVIAVNDRQEPTHVARHPQRLRSPDHQPQLAHPGRASVQAPRRNQPDGDRPHGAQDQARGQVDPGQLGTDPLEAAHKQHEAGAHGDDQASKRGGEPDPQRAAPRPAAGQQHILIGARGLDREAALRAVSSVVESAQVVTAAGAGKIPIDLALVLRLPVLQVPGRQEP
jgi:hypothetical protein